VADAPAEPAGRSQHPLIQGARPQAWYSPTHGYIVFTRHPISPVMVFKRVIDKVILDALPEDAAEFILKEPWRRFPTDQM